MAVFRTLHSRRTLTINANSDNFSAMTQGLNAAARENTEAWRQTLEKGHSGQNMLRRVMRNLPSSPRCKVCNNPFAGIGGKLCALIGMSRSKKNPNICALCCEHMPRGGAEIDTAVLFADIRNSTEIAEKLGPTSYSDALNRFYSVATEVLIHHDAVVDKLIGDEVMAFFVPGHAGPNFRRVAVEAGREMMAKTGSQLAIGIGMESGIAFAGNIGAENVVDFTVLGDPVNVAARIQAAALPGEILLGANLYGSVKDNYPGSKSRSLKIKGKSKPLRVFSITA
jgi:adenylate cyclase